jgi:hypothetical protein
MQRLAVIMMIVNAVREISWWEDDMRNAVRIPAVIPLEIM